MTKIHKLWRVGLLAVIAIGIVLAMTSPASSSRPFGQTGYVTVTSRVLLAQPAGESDGGSDGISSWWIITFAVIVLAGGGVAYREISRRRADTY